MGSAEAARLLAFPCEFLATTQLRGVAARLPTKALKALLAELGGFVDAHVWLFWLIWLNGRAAHGFGLCQAVFPNGAAFRAGQALGVHGPAAYRRVLVFDAAFTLDAGVAFFAADEGARRINNRAPDSAWVLGAVLCLGDAHGAGEALGGYCQAARLWCVFDAAFTLDAGVAFFAAGELCLWQPPKVRASVAGVLAFAGVVPCLWCWDRGGEGEHGACCEREGCSSCWCG